MSHPTNALSGDFQKIVAWRQARPIGFLDPDLWREDDYGSMVYWHNYGDRQSDYGWEVDHVWPTSLGGLGLASNVRALHWRNNASLGGQLANALARR